MKKSLLLTFCICLVSLLQAQRHEVAQPEIFGEGVKSTEVHELDELWTMMEGKDTLDLTLTANVVDVCQKKGCWMHLYQPGQKEKMLMVQFKDYGFFMPKDIAERQVVVEGYAYRSVTPVDELRHYAEDAGKSKEEIEAITEPKEEIKFLASGVKLLPN